MNASRTQVLFVVFAIVALFMGFVPARVQAQFLTDEDRARLQNEYNQIQAEIAEWQKVLEETRSKKSTLQGDVTALNALIKKSEAEIKKRNVSIKGLADDIASKQGRITELEQKLDRSKDSLADMLRAQKQADEQSLAELILSSDDFNGFFGDLELFAVVRRDLLRLSGEVIAVKSETEDEKQALTVKRDEELDAKHEVEVTKNQITVNEAEKKKLLTFTTDQEKAYSTVLAERERKAEQIRNALFPLRDAQGISFGTALEYAAYATEKTGVRTAMILAILSQESDLGKNVGSCYVTSLDTGDGIGKNTGTFFQKIMKAPRDTAPFERITSALGLLWASEPVSCPLKPIYSSSRGYGGAMGPSQFIPSTWELYEKKLKIALGVSMPNPWDAKHAIMATALYLKDLGAAAQTYTAERNAACRYYSGRACDSKSPPNTAYGNNVISKAESFQANIDFLKGI